jgi:hypothetical protein
MNCVLSNTKGRYCHLFPRQWLRERKFITATKIRRGGDIAVVAQFKRNAGIGVALSGSA